MTTDQAGVLGWDALTALSRLDVPGLRPGQALTAVRAGGHVVYPRGVQPEPRAPPECVGSRPQFDDGTATISMQWGDAGVDWDLYIVNAANQVVAQSASFGTPSESALMIDPPAGDYRAIIVNYEGGETDDWSSASVTFANPLPETRTGIKESWQPTCSKPGGQVKSRRDVVVDRGQTVDLGNVCQKIKER